MIEQDIFNTIQNSFLKSEELEDIRILTFMTDETQKPCIHFSGDALSNHSAQISLEIQSDYKGASELATLRKEIRKLLNTGSLRDAFYEYAFKEESSSKNNILKFTTKRFRTGE